MSFACFSFYIALLFEVESDGGGELPGFSGRTAPFAGVFTGGSLFSRCVVFSVSSGSNPVFGLWCAQWEPYGRGSF